MVARSATARTYPESAVLVAGRVVAGPGLTPVLLVLAVLFVEQLLVQRQALMVEGVAHPVALGAQVGLVMRVGHGLDRDLIGDREPVALQAQDLLRVVGEDPDAGQTQVNQDLAPMP